MTQTALDHRAEAARHEQEAYDSFERCDTDGALSQWASGINAQKHRLQAEVAEAGGVSQFPALFDLDGNRVPAKLIGGQFGPCWAFCDGDGQFTGQFVSAFPKRTSTMERKGYREGEETAPAQVVTAGHDLCSTHAQVIRTDGGYPGAKAS